jgi:tetratricopeptide (TPR) repeat protein
MKHLFLSAMLCGAAVVSSVPAHADKRSQAMAQFEKGEQLYAEGNYADALKSFQSAYKLEKAPLLFVNIAQCHRQLGNHEAAIASLERYLQQEPEADNRADVEELLATERALLDPPPEPEVAAPAPEPTTTTAPMATVTPTPAIASAMPAGEAEGSESLLASPTLWIAVGGAALVVLAGGAVLTAAALQPPPVQPTGSLGTFDLR